MKTKSKSHKVAFLIMVTTACAIIKVAAACMNESASLENRIKPCCPCAEMKKSKGTTGGACSYLRAETLAFCDCQLDRNCRETGVMAYSYQVRTFTNGTCGGCANGCQNAEGGEISEASIMLKETINCGS